MGGGNPGILQDLGVLRFPFINRPSSGQSPLIRTITPFQNNHPISKQSPEFKIPFLTDEFQYNEADAVRLQGRITPG